MRGQQLEVRDTRLGLETHGKMKMGLRVAGGKIGIDCAGSQGYTVDLIGKKDRT